jgi:hypothetical protein
MSEMPRHIGDETCTRTLSDQFEMETGISSLECPEPLITTLIPTYQRAKLLERAIGSVLDQTYPHLRICVYDNASEDDTGDVVRKLSTADPRVRYFRNAENIGALKNFIRAMESVDTPFFSFLSDDDVLLPQFYETAMEGFKKYPEAMLSATANLRIDDAGKVLEVNLLNWKPGLYQPPDGFVAMLDKMHPDWTSVVFRQCVLQEAGGLDEETGGAFDLDYLLRVAARFPIVVSTEFGAIFVAHGRNVSANLTLGPTRTGWLKMIQNQTEDERVPARARDHARQVLTERFKQTLFVAHGLGAITRGNWQASRQAAQILRRDYGLWARASMLSVASWTCERLPLAHRATAACRVAMRLFKRVKRGPLQKKFGSYAAYLGRARREAR